MIQQFAWFRRGAVGALCVVIAGMLSGCPTPTPKITPTARGTFTCPQTVTISDANALAAIFYTIDGTTPTSSATKYTAPFTISNTSTVKAIALAPGASVSKIGIATYTCTTTNLTRADFVVLLLERFNLPQPSHPPNIPDVRPTDAIYPAVAAAAPFMNPQILCPGCQLNMNFFPNEPITRAISAIALVRILKANNQIQLLSLADAEKVLSNVTDAKSLPPLARPYFATAIQNGILTLSTGNTIQPNLPHTRADMMLKLDRIKTQFKIVTPTT